MLILVGEPSTTNRWRCCSLLLCLNNMLSYFDTQSQKLFSLLTWPSETFVGGQGCFHYLCLRQKYRFSSNNYKWGSPNCTRLFRSSQRQKKDRDIEKNVGVMSSFFIFCRCMHVFFLFIYSKTFCTSECFKERCVGEDRKSSHQLATDSVWELFASCWMFKLFAFTVNILQLLLMSQIMNILRVNTVR